MITRLTGLLESIEGLEATIAVGEMAYLVLIPAYEKERLSACTGQSITLHTMHYLENQGQGSSYIPRLIGFASTHERRFFELLTSMDGFGNRRALRAMAHEPALIARAILGADAAWLTRLPEIGKKTAEKVILELKGKVQPFLSPEEVVGLDAAAGAGELGAARAESEAVSQAIGALIALGEQRSEAEQMVRRACGRDTALREPGTTADQIIAAVYQSGSVRA